MAKGSKLEKIYTVDCQEGHYEFKLNSVLDKKHVTKNSIVVKKSIDFNTMQRLSTGNLTRIDLDVIAKLCNELDCGITDLIEYVNDKK